MGGEKLRAVCFINQFFGQIGGERRAGVGLSVSEEPVGPAALFDSLLGSEGEVVATIICGDNYFAENIEEATKKSLELIKKYSPDLLFCGPAFNAGRYGMSCGSVASAAGKALCIPAITGMHPENPAAEIFRRDTYIIKTGIRSSQMRTVAEKMARLALRLARGEKVGSAADEGYIKRDRIRNEVLEKNAARRSVDMLLNKLRGEEYETELPLPVFKQARPAPPIEDLKNAKVAIVSDGGLIPVGNPDGMRAHSCMNWGKYDLDELLRGSHYVIHNGYDGTFALEDPNRLYPGDALREAGEQRLIGEMGTEVYVTSGNCMAIATAEEMGKEMARDLLDSGVAAAILTST